MQSTNSTPSETSCRGLTMEGKARLSLTSSIKAHRVATCDKKLFNILRDDLLLFSFFFLNFFKFGLC